MGGGHFNIAKEYLKKNEYENAIREFKAILVADEFNPNIYSEIGEAYFNLRDFKSSEENYLKAYSLTNNIFFGYHLGLVEFNLKNLKYAIHLLQNCLDDYDEGNIGLSSSDIEDVRYHLALAYFQDNEKDKSENELKILLKNNPKYEKAAALLKKIKSLSKNS